MDIRALKARQRGVAVCVRCDARLEDGRAESGCRSLKASKVMAPRGRGQSHTLSGNTTRPTIRMRAERFPCASTVSPTSRSSAVRVFWERASSSVLTGGRPAVTTGPILPLTSSMAETVTFRPFTRMDTSSP